jgi:hypothetical protein
MPLHWGVNVLTVSLQLSIHALHARGWSRRRIAREPGVHRKTVAGYIAEPKVNPRANHSLANAACQKC